MDSKMTYVSILLSSLLAITALCILGLAADNISHVQNQSSHSAIDIHYQRWNQTAHRPYQYWVTMDYLPSKFTLSGMEGMLAASVIAGIVGVCVAVTSCLHRMDARKQQQRSSSITLLNLVLSAIAFIVTLATAAYAWKPVMRYPIKFINSLPLPPQYKTHATAHSEVRYQSPFPYTPEVWNCQLWPYVVQKDLSTRLHNLCQEAGVAKDLMIVAVFLSAAQLVCVVWTWRKARLAAADVTNGVKEVDEMSIISKK